MAEENIRQEFKLKNIDETRNCFIEEIKQDKLITKIRIKVCTNIKYIKHFILDSPFSGCISISAFSSMIGILIGITSSAFGLKISAIAAGIKKKHDKIVLSAKSKLNSIEVLISKALIGSVISYNLINDVQKKHMKMKKEIKYLKS